MFDFSFLNRGSSFYPGSSCFGRSPKDSKGASKTKQRKGPKPSYTVAATPHLSGLENDESLAQAQLRDGTKTPMREEFAKRMSMEENLAEG